MQFWRDLRKQAWNSPLHLFFACSEVCATKCLFQLVEEVTFSHLVIYTCAAVTGIKHTIEIIS